MANVKVEETGTSNSNNKTEDEVFDYDKILEEEVGQFGWFQVRNILLALIAVIFLAWGNNSYVFTAARIPTRCRIPECDLAEPEFTPEWLLSAIPGTSLNSFDNCQRFGNTSLVNSQEGECPATWFDRNQQQECEEYVYGNTETIVYDFDLACDEWRRSIVGSIRLSGTIFAQTITGFISDRWGRRTALVFNAFNAAWIGILRSFSPNYIIFVATEFLSSVVGSATFQTSYILVMELVAPDRRVIVGACMNTFSSVGLIILGLVAWAVPYWRTLTRVLFIPQLLTITYLCILTESVRWYISKNRYEDVEKSLINIARVNKKEVSETTLRILKNKANEGITNQKKLREEGNENKQNKPSLIKLLFQYKPVLIRSLIAPFWWISFTLIYQGITINSVDISGNKYINYIAVSCAQIPGFWISLLLLDKIGRKPVLMAAYWLCAACEIAFIFVPNDQRVLSLAVYMFGATCSGAIFSSVYIYTAELYPTQFRHRLFGFSSTVGRFGAVLAPLTPALGTIVWVHLPFALFAGFACVSGALVLLTPETRGVRLPNTMQEAADLGRKKHSTDI